MFFNNYIFFTRNLNYQPIVIVYYRAKNPMVKTSIIKCYGNFKAGIKTVP